MVANLLARLSPHPEVCVGSRIAKEFNCVCLRILFKPFYILIIGLQFQWEDLKSKTNHCALFALKEVMYLRDSSLGANIGLRQKCEILAHTNLVLPKCCSEPIGDYAAFWCKISSDSIMWPHKSENLLSRSIYGTLHFRAAFAAWRVYSLPVCRVKSNCSWDFPLTAHQWRIIRSPTRGIHGSRFSII